MFNIYVLRLCLISISMYLRLIETGLAIQRAVALGKILDFAVFAVSCFGMGTTTLSITVILVVRAAKKNVRNIPTNTVPGFFPSPQDKTYICMYVCVCVCVYIYIYIYIYIYEYTFK
jgi:hypothetical protein